MIQLGAPGGYIVEAASGVRPITTVATSVAAFIDYFSEGPTGTPTPSWARSRAGSCGGPVVEVEPSAQAPLAEDAVLLVQEVDDLKLAGVDPARHSEDSEPHSLGIHRSDMVARLVINLGMRRVTTS